VSDLVQTLELEDWEIHLFSVLWVGRGTRSIPVTVVLDIEVARCVHVFELLHHVDFLYPSVQGVFDEMLIIIIKTNHI